MSKPVLLILSVLVTLVFVYLIWSAIAARQRSNETLEKFREIDDLLSKPADSSSSAGVGAFSTRMIQDNFKISSAGTKAILYIDSLTSLINKEDQYVSSTLNKKQIEKLKTVLQDFNSAINSSGDLSSDTLTMNVNEKGNGPISWEKFYFSGPDPEPVLTYLVFLKNRIIQIQGIKFQSE